MSHTASAKLLNSFSCLGRTEPSGSLATPSSSSDTKRKVSAAIAGPPPLSKASTSGRSIAGAVPSPSRSVCISAAPKVA